MLYNGVLGMGRFLKCIFRKIINELWVSMRTTTV